MTFDFQPTLKGPTLLLNPLGADDLDALHAAASDPAIWALHPEPTRWRRQVFERGFFASALASRSAFTVRTRSSGEVIGSSRYYAHVPNLRTVFVGYTFLCRAFWGGGANAELKALMLDHAFRFVDAVCFHIGPDNLRARRSIEKLGGALVGDDDVVREGRTQQRLVYRITRPAGEGRPED
ncbi:MAG: GNAT family N-acetyltransferase [Candidatus Sericytochromatia bacterium]|nr:GNAT family N-acetyltransferase [Candidatus Sericytochromatia bacterium]